MKFTRRNDVLVTAAALLLLLLGFLYLKETPVTPDNTAASPTPDTPKTVAGPLEVSTSPPESSDPDVFGSPVPESALASHNKAPSHEESAALSYLGQEELASRYGDLAEAARRGDALSALALGNGLSVCRLHFRELREVEASMSRDRLYTSEDEKSVAVARAEKKMGSPAFLTRESNCRGITEAQVDEDADWLLTAANLGNAFGAHNYVSAMAPRLGELATDPPRLMQFRADASRLMHRDASRCVPTAYHWLSITYREGIFEQRDPVRAAAYGAVFQWKARVASPTTATITYGLPPLDSRQIRQAQDLATRIYNSYCRP